MPPSSGFGAFGQSSAGFGGFGPRLPLHVIPLQRKSRGDWGGGVSGVGSVGRWAGVPDTLFLNLRALEVGTF